ncbi:unnamed protein product [Cyclocybe aegerita]|uniref:Fido domain-containing protein n=1 Tax=Cyclocybe aegerita TaxID=1973307 RepID=A0A8S0WF35_CYCAE|nr:unnamed protein product [Cyclocybe aegerita]
MFETLIRTVSAAYAPNGPCALLPANMEDMDRIALMNSIQAPPDQYGGMLQFWEATFLPKYRCTPVLILVADGRARGGDLEGVLQLYTEALHLVSPPGDPEFHKFVLEFTCQCEVRREENSKAWSLMKPSEPWTSVRSMDFPTELEPALIYNDFSLWSSASPETRRRYEIFSSLQTNIMEGVFKLPAEVIECLVNLNSIEPDEITQISFDSATQDVLEIADVLADTMKAFAFINDLNNCDSSRIDRKMVLDVHQLVLTTSGCLLTQTSSFSQSLQYHPGSVSRSSSKTNVYIQGCGGSIVQFCPFEKVDEELDLLINLYHRYEELHHSRPFAQAAWLHMVLITCHPFTDGNG